MFSGGRKMALVGAGLLVVVVVVVVVAGLVLASREDPTPVERLTELSATEPVEVGGRDPIRFVRWIGPETRGDGAVSKAIYTNGDDDLGFEIFVLGDPGAARDMFRSERAELLTWDEEIQQINTFADSEYCARLGDELRCVGFLPDRPFYFTSFGPTGGDDFDVLALLRTARKHWFRVYS